MFLSTRPELLPERFWWYHWKLIEKKQGNMLMATNIEIKAKVQNPDRLKKRAEALSDAPPRVIHQEDTFFHVAKGRLKLRILASKRGELIYYERPDASGPKRSDYFISRTADPESLKTLLSASLGVRGVVRKRRLLYLVGNTRVHLDEVEGLGSFMELEVILNPERSDKEGKAIALELMAKLGVTELDLIDRAYIDLLGQRAIEASSESLEF